MQNVGESKSTRSLGRPVAWCKSTSRRRVVVEWLLVALVAIGLLVAYISVARATEPEILSTREVFIESGDTLWSLARTYPAEGLTTSETATLIGDLNDVDPASLQPGSRILVPSDISLTGTEVASSE